MECGTFKAQAAHAKHSDPEVPGTAIREGEWEPQISFEIFDHCPKINLKKQTQTPNLRYTDQQVARAPRKDLENNRRPTQQPELQSETERAKHGSNQLCYSTAAVSATVPPDSPLQWATVPDIPLQSSGQSLKYTTVPGQSTGRIEWKSDRSKIASLHRIDPISLKSIPTATKLGMDDHKAVGELPLRGHGSIWGESTGNQRNPKNSQKFVHELKLSGSTISWGISRFPSVESFNSCHRSIQGNKNESKRSRNEESRGGRRGGKRNSRRTPRTHKNT